MSAVDIAKTTTPAAAPTTTAEVTAETLSVPNAAGVPNITTPPAKLLNASTTLKAKNQQQTQQTQPANDEKTENATDAVEVKGKTAEEFYQELQQFHERRGTPIMHVPQITGVQVDLHKLYTEVTERGGFAKVNNRDEWEELLPVLKLRDRCVNATAALKYIYRRCLEKYERLSFFGEDPDKSEALEAGDAMESGRARARYTSTMQHAGQYYNVVPMSYNYRQHVVNMERRRLHKMCTDLYEPTAYEKLMLSLLSPLPNEQDFAINACTVMANEAKHTLRLHENPKILDVLLAHTGVFKDYSLRQLFQHIYTNVRRHSLFSFWRDLLFQKPDILQMFASNEQALAEAALIDAKDCIDVQKEIAKVSDYLSMDFLQLARAEGTQEYVGQRVQQVLFILRHLSFFDENKPVFAKNRTLLRFLVMCANVRWNDLHMQAFDIAGNVANELELQDHMTDDVSRCFMRTLCEGVESTDRAVIISCLEIIYKLCQKDSNEERIYRCLNLKFFETICMYLSLNDIMLLIFTLEAIYALTLLGARSCHLIMQVRGVLDQLMSLITVEAQSYGAEGCILMRVVETVPGNMLPLVAQNIANMQNASVTQNKQQQVTTTTTSTSTNTSTTVAAAAATETTELPAALQPQQTTQQQQPATQQQQPQTATQQQQQQTTMTAPPSKSDEEQYALSWLSATFERTTSVNSHIEQKDMYRMYVTHCQKAGRSSVASHMQFPRLVRTIFTSQVGPVMVRRTDGTEIPGMHYVTIRLRAQPLPIIQSKTLNTTTAAAATTANTPSKIIESARKIKKKVKMPEQEQTPTATENAAETTADALAPKSHSQETFLMPQQQLPTTITTPPVPALALVAETDNASSSSGNSDGLQQSFTSLIKCMLANKVNQRQQKQKEVGSVPTNVITTAATLQQQPPAATTPIIKVASTAISEIVNNPLLHNTPVKVGQTTIKPLNPQSVFEKKQILESAPPPLAPLSGNNVAKDATGRPIIISNQLLVDRLEKKHEITLGTTASSSSSNIMKRKLDDSNTTQMLEVNKRMTLEEDMPVTPSKNAANLYAEMAASILEDEDLDEMLISNSNQLEQQQQQSVIMQQVAAAANASMQNVQRQLLFQSSNQQSTQLKLGTQTMPATAMATIKTDQGLQTVPVILQQKPLEQQQQHQQQQQQQTQLIQQVIQHQQQQQQQQQAQTQTQYVLATNPQGQTYLVAQQAPAPTVAPPPPPPTQTVLVTQTPQQQTAGTKTIIILQQQSMPSTQPQQQQQLQQQKMLMTAPQCQVLLTQRAQPQPSMSTNSPQYFISAQPHIQHVPVSAAQNMAPNMMQRQLIQTMSQPQQPTQPLLQQSGQISPSLLSQLNHIPATIKLHQPQQAPMQIPQLQQHQSIIQQHIISSPAATAAASASATEKRQQVIVGGRTIEIKETVITQTPSAAAAAAPTALLPTQTQLNSQTIISQTTMPAPTTAPASMIQQHPTIIQQKINMPAMSAQQQQQPSIISQKLDPPSLVQPIKPTTMHTQTVVQTIVQPTTIVTQAGAAGTAAGAIKKPIAAALKPLKPTLTTTTDGPPPLSVSIPNMTPTTTGDANNQEMHVLARRPTPPATPTTTTQMVTVDPNWLYVCDWRNCPRRKFKSIADLQHHACTAHCPDHLDASAEIYCQWGTGPTLCDGIPRKRYSLMTHLIDRHMTSDSLRTAMQRRIATGTHNVQPTQAPVTIVRNVDQSQRGSTASPALSTSSSSSSLPSTGSSAMQAIKRHTADYVNSKDLGDENEGPVTKSIRLTAALILRNLVSYNSTAKRSLRRYEPHLAAIALSNVESSVALSHVLYELSN